MRMTRDHLLSYLLVAVLMLGLAPRVGAAPASPGASPPEAAFADWPAGSWCEDAFRWAVENGVVQGRTETSVAPWAPAKRAEFAALLNRAFATYKLRSLDSFSDVPPSSWYHDELAMSYQMRSIQGTGPDTMEPEQYVTREQAITAISRVLCLPLPDDPGVVLAPYNDTGEVSSWALAHVAASVQAGIIVGTAEDQLSPGKEITRAELVQALRRVFYRFADAGEITGDYQETVIVRSADVDVHDATFAHDLIIANGAGDHSLELANVTIKGRLLVWGGSTIDVTGKSTVAAVTTPRNDGAVKVVFDAMASTRSEADCIIVYPDIMDPENEVVFTPGVTPPNVGGGGGGGGGDIPTPPPTPPIDEPEDVLLDHVVTIMYWDWDDTLMGVQYVKHSDVRADVNEYVRTNLIHPDLADNTNVTSLARIDNYRGKWPAEGPRPLRASSPTIVQDGEDYPLTNKLDYVFFKRVTSVEGRTWSQATGSGAWDTTYPYIHGWLHVPAPGAQSPTQGDFTILGDYYSVLGHTGELADYNGHPGTSGRMDPVELTSGYTGLGDQYHPGSDYLKIADFSDIRELENSNHIVTVKAIYEPGEDLLGPDDGGYYTMTQAPNYYKITDSSSGNPTGVFGVSFALSRYSEAPDGVHGVSRTRTPSMDFQNIMDLYYIGIHDHANGNSFHHELRVSNDEDILVSYSVAGAIHALDYYLVDKYDTNFVVAPRRSRPNEEQPVPVLPNFACESYAGLVPIGKDDDHLERPDIAYGTNGFVFWGELVNVCEHMTKYARDGLDNLPGVDRENLMDLNLRIDGKFVDRWGQNTAKYYLVNMATEAYQAHLDGNDEWWDPDTGTLDLDYHQLQHYIDDQELLPRSEADALVIPWCKLHDACIAAGAASERR